QTTQPKFVEHCIKLAALKAKSFGLAGGIPRVGVGDGATLENCLAGMGGRLAHSFLDYTVPRMKSRTSLSRLGGLWLCPLLSIPAATPSMPDGIFLFPSGKWPRTRWPVDRQRRR